MTIRVSTFNTDMLFCLASLVTLVSAGTTLQEFKVYTMQYGEPLAAITAWNQLDCARTCSGNAACRSAIFEDTSTCLTNTWVTNVTNICGTGHRCEDPTALIYMEKIPKTTMLEGCVNDSDCVDLKSACVLGQCQCEPGYHFDGNNYACVTSCSSYGTTFQTDVSHRIASNNLENISGLTLEECQELCIAETAFDCRTFEYGNIRFSDVHCRLQNVTALDVPADYESFSDINLYTRDCALI